MMLEAQEQMEHERQVNILKNSSLGSAKQELLKVQGKLNLSGKKRTNLTMEEME